MTVSFMKWVDKALGSPLCLIALLLEILPRRRPRQPVQDVLLIKFWGMGSMVLASQAFQDLRAAHKNARFTALTFQSNAEVLTWLECADEILTVRNRSFWSFLRDLSAVCWVLLSRRWDMAIDFEFGTRFTALLAALSRAGCKVGFTFPGRVRDRLFTQRVLFRQDRHVRENFLALARGAGAQPSAAWTPRPFPDETRERARSLIGGEGGRPVVCINPNVGELAPARRWPAQSFIDLSSRLLEEGARLVLIGARSDVDAVRKIVEALPAGLDVVNAAGRTDFAMLGSLLSLCDLLISSDAGPVHLAWALSVPVVTLFGPETPVLYGPPSGFRRVLYRGLPCSPCIDAAKAKVPPPCPHREACVRGIGVEEVLAAARSLLVEANRPSLKEARHGDGNGHPTTG